MFHSLRAFSDDLATARANLMDNSITASAKNIWLEFYWDGAKSHIVVIDGRRGMSDTELRNDIRPGSRSPLAEHKAQN